MGGGNSPLPSLVDRTLPGFWSHSAAETCMCNIERFLFWLVIVAHYNVIFKWCLLRHAKSVSSPGAQSDAIISLMHELNPCSDVLVVEKLAEPHPRLASIGN